MEPARFYTGLVAELYAALRSHVYDDPTPWRRFIAGAGEPALELGCGDGDPLLALRELGLDVDGLDSSADMLERCRAAAASRGLEVTLYHQAMEDMHLPRRYRAIFLAGPTFNLLPDDDTAVRALAAIRRQLAADGTALVPLFIPDLDPPDDLGQPREHHLDDGTLLRVAALRVDIDRDRRTSTTLLRYERHLPGESVEQVERPWVLHWYDPETFHRLAAQAGLEVTDVRPTSDDDPDGGIDVRLVPAPR
jgi:SAM-dependent methyltransferase